jgi:hypothetical protein
MHRPFVTTVKFENENGGVMRLEYAVADTSDAKTELERPDCFSSTQSTTPGRDNEEEDAGS